MRTALRALVAVVVVATATMGIAGCSEIPDAEFSVGDVPMTVCGPTHASGQMTVGVTTVQSDLDVRIVSVEPVGSDSLSVLGWYLGSPSAYIGLGNEYSAQDEGADGAILVAGAAHALQVGIEVSDPSRGGGADAFRVSAEAPNGGGLVERTVPLSLELVPEGDTCTQ